MVKGFENVEGLSARALRVKDVFLKTLKDNYRYPNHIKSPKIEQGLNLSGSEIRALVHYHRANGQLVLSSQKGYSWTDNPKVAQDTIESLKQRSNSILRALKGMEAGVAMLNSGEQGDLALDVKIDYQSDAWYESRK